MTDYLDEIQARADAATDGPWATNDEDEITADGRRIVWPAATYADDCWLEITPADAVFIAHARTDVPRLVATLRAVEALHRPTERQVVDRAVESVCAYCWVPYPCPTVTAIRDALEAR